MGNITTTQYNHATHFYKLIITYPIDETACLNYIDKYSDFYNIKMGNYESTALMSSMRVNASDELLIKLIEQNVDVNPTRVGLIPTRFSSEKSFGVNTVDRYGDTPLIWAIIHGKYNIVTHLVNAGAQINRDIKYKPILYDALHYDRLEIAKYLIDKGAEFNTLLCYDSNKIDTSYFRFDKYANSYGEFEDICRQKFDIYPNIVGHIKLRYKESIHGIINDKSADNVMANCFATTYVPQLVDVICEFII
ncbi:MAG: hypothetical protein Faunusvirus29_5 [Faunusvirus sp.]|jgi:hypothetical protein|uniref:Uncharacterized protein n=1 Tax=Faunusvirus sp. TaxID=2487766 RepID=A0A3G4ZXI5_9VIRU|nr:MAG: hypothetical protein Faunusvirus29_5 [Faunusvirus sp.]